MLAVKHFTSFVFGQAITLASKLPVNGNADCIDKNLLNDQGNIDLIENQLPMPNPYWSLDLDSDLGNHLDPWGAAMFNGGLFDSLPSVGSSSSLDQYGPLQESEYSLAEHFKEWDPQMESNDEQDETTETHASSLNASETAHGASIKTKDRKGERAIVAEKKAIVYEQFGELNWTSDMSPNELAIHASMMKPRGQARVITEGIEDALVYIGATAEYIQQFKKFRTGHNQRRYNLIRRVKSFDNLTVEQRKQREKVVKKLEECNVDLEDTPIHDLELMTRPLNDMKMSSTMYDDILRDLVFQARGPTDALGFKLFRKEFRDKQIRVRRAKMRAE